MVTATVTAVGSGQSHLILFQRRVRFLGTRVLVLDYSLRSVLDDHPVSLDEIRVDGLGYVVEKRQVNHEAIAPGTKHKLTVPFLVVLGARRCGHPGVIHTVSVGYHQG